MAEFSYLNKLQEALWALENADYSERGNREDLRRATIQDFRRQVDVIYRLCDDAKSAQMLMSKRNR